MLKRIAVRRTATWDGSMTGSRNEDSEARLYTSHPEFVTVLRIEADVFKGMTVEYAHVEIADDFPEDGFIATFWVMTSDIITAGGCSEVGYDMACLVMHHVAHRVICEHGSPDSLEGRDFQSAFSAWLDAEQPEAVKFLDSAPRTSRWLSIAGLLRRVRFWDALAPWLRLRGVQIGRIGERLEGAQVDTRTYAIQRWSDLAPIRIAEALGFRPSHPEPQPWNGLQGATELTIPRG